MKKIFTLLMLFASCTKVAPREPLPLDPDGAAEADEALEEATPTDDVPPYDPENIDYDE